MGGALQMSRQSFNLTPERNLKLAAMKLNSDMTKSELIGIGIDMLFDVMGMAKKISKISETHTPPSISDIFRSIPEDGDIGMILDAAMTAIMENNFQTSQT